MLQQTIHPWSSASVVSGTCRFDDQLGFSAFVNERIGMKFHSYQLASGPSAYECDYLHFPEISLWIARTRPLQTEYEEFIVPEGSTLVSTSRERLDIFCNKWRSDFQPLMIFPGGQLTRGVFPLGYEAVDVLVPNELLELSGVSHQSLAAIANSEGPIVCDLDSLPIQAFLDDLLRHVIGASRQKGGPRDAMARQAYDVVTNQLAEAVELGVRRFESADLQPVRRADLFSAATEYMDARIKEPVTVDQIARDLGVSSRLLGYAFRDSLGMSPYQFLLLKKLHGARETIQNSNLPVSEIAAQYGFSTDSRFRRQYTRLFGELPSETRKLSIHSA